MGKGSKKCIIGAVIATLAGASMALAGFGDLQATYNFEVASFLMDPQRPYMYASLPTQNSVAVINTDTLAVERTIFIGSNPRGMALAGDGSRLYVANNGSNFIGVLNTQNWTTENSLQVSAAPIDLEMGLDNRLFVLTSSAIQQVNALSGGSAGPVLPVWTYSGSLEISPDKRWLYYGESGLSPSSFSKIDVSTTNTSLVGGRSLGSNGRQLTLSHDGTMITHPCGAPYNIPIVRTSDLVTLGTLNTSHYPEVVAFSPDDVLAYTSAASQDMVKVFSTQTFLQQGSIQLAEDPAEMAVDSSGRHLFVALHQGYGSVPGYVQVFDTGRSVPEPAALSVLGLVASASTLRRRR